jgi:hypothetical protein
MNPNLIVARDRRMAAVHEAGHIVVGRHVGLTLSSAWIAPNDGPPMEEKTWIGRVQFITGLDHLNSLERCRVGCAGAAAELCWSGEYIDPFYWDDPEIMSPSDWRLCDCEPGEPAQVCIEAIYDLRCLLPGGPMWREILQEARRLIVDCRW